MLRAIHLFPEFPNADCIERLRAKYDPLFGLIPPHITLVFPFESEIPSDTLASHVTKSVADWNSFHIVLTGVTGADGEYVFLNVKVGNDAIIRLHDNLYSGILQPYLNRSFPYTPHLTLGRFQRSEALQLALADTETFHEVFETAVNEVVIECIDECGKSTTELKVPLGSSENVQ